VEIWNDVFMQYNKKNDGTFVPLSQQNVDTGMGLERVATVLQGKSNVYETDLFAPIIEKIESHQPSAISHQKNQRAIRIIADHVRAATFILGDQYGIAPSNEDQGYVLRKLIRRAIRYSHVLGIEKSFLSDLAKVTINNFKDVYPELAKNQKYIIDQLDQEEEKFQRTLAKGLKKFEKGERNAFYLYESFGFPPELTKELFAEQGIEFDQTKFDADLKKHQKLSRQGAKQKFAGGLADTQEQTKKLHTATHLLNQALRVVLGKHVEQKGSNITHERLRFDFPHPQKMTPEQIKKVEDLVNEQIKKGVLVKIDEMNLDQAKKKGAIGLFPDKYNAQVKVFSIGDFSNEICGGPHVDNTSELGHFRIVKEESSSAGVRRIKAILE